MKNPDDYFKDVPFVATEEDLLSIGASVPAKTEEKTKYKAFTGSIKNEASEPVVLEDQPRAEAPKGTKQEKRESDFEYTRSNLYNVIETAMNAMSHLSQIAGQSQHPRAFEVLAALAKTITDANNQLIKLHADKQKIDNEDAETAPTSGGGVTNNNLFIGTTAEFDEMVKKLGLKKKDE